MTLLFVVMLAVSGQNEGASPERVLGVLEQPQCKQEPVVAVRALFAKQGRDWVALANQEAAKSVSMPGAWTVGFDGRNLGAVATIDPGFETEYAWTFSRDHLLLTTPGQSIPEVANKQGAFGGWCEPPSRRPLVVVSSPAVQDPDRWKPYQPRDGLRPRLFEPFKSHAGIASICLENSEATRPLAYDAKDLVFRSGYQDRSGRKLVTVGLDPLQNTCDGPPEPAWETHTFVVQDQLVYLGPSLTLVDAGDYDSDGAAELVFWYSGYNEDGYTLFYDGFRKHVDYRWKYH